MLTKEKVKSFIQENCNPSLTGISSASPFSSADKERFRNCMRALKEGNPIHSNEELFNCTDFMEDAKAVIVLATNSYFGEIAPRANEKINPVGEIGDFYMNDNIINSGMEKSGKIVNFLKSNGFEAEVPFVGFSQKAKAAEAGIGKIGKNTLVINEKYGSWLTLSTIITNAPLEPDSPAKDDCGKCNICVEACPTGALSKPYNLNVGKCITYFLCHLKTEIPRQYREAIGVNIGNCTICSDVCPYNKQDLAINKKDKMPDEVIYPELIPSLNITEEKYQEKYGVKFFDFIMGGRRYFRRNVAVALGNSKCEKAVPELLKALVDEDKLVRSHTAWALGKISGEKTKKGLEKALLLETNQSVKEEIESALKSNY